MRKFAFISLLFVCSLTYSQTSSSNTVVSLKTNYGEIKIELYPETAKHRENFLKLVRSGFYNGVLFHRIIANFMIQTGDPESKNARPNQFLGSGDLGYTIPAEIVYPQYYHKRGAIAAARQGDNVNPKKASSGAQFYIVTGRKYSEAEISAMETNFFKKRELKMYQDIYKKNLNVLKKYQLAKNQEKIVAFKDSIYSEVHIDMAINPARLFSEQQRKDYITIGGAHHLDGDYTVFGEVTEGLEIVDKIGLAKTGSNDRPVEDIKIIKATVLK